VVGCCKVDDLINNETSYPHARHRNCRSDNAESDYRNREAPVCSPNEQKNARELTKCTDSLPKWRAVLHSRRAGGR
jgi:hypothetical protein